MLYASKALSVRLKTLFLLRSAVPSALGHAWQQGPGEVKMCCQKYTNHTWPLTTLFELHGALYAAISINAVQFVNVLFIQDYKTWGGCSGSNSPVSKTVVLSWWFWATLNSFCLLKINLILNISVVWLQFGRGRGDCVRGAGLRAAPAWMATWSWEWSERAPSAEPFCFGKKAVIRCSPWRK